MTYRPTVKMYHRATYAAVESGALRLQPGQWIALHRGDKPSRWAGFRGSSLVAAHPRGAEGVKLEKLRQLIDYAD